MATPRGDSKVYELENQIEYEQAVINSLEGMTSDNANRERADYSASIKELSARLEHKKKQFAQNIGSWNRSWGPGSPQVDQYPYLAAEQSREAHKLGEVSSTDTSPGADSVLSSPSPPAIPTGKRARESFASILASKSGHERKYRRTTPSPAHTGPTTPSSLGSLDIPAETIEAAKAILGQDFSIRKLRDEAKATEQRFEQERRDAEYARLLQEAPANADYLSSQLAAQSHSSHQDAYAAGPSIEAPIKNEFPANGLGDTHRESFLLPYSSQSNGSTTPFSTQQSMRPVTQPLIELSSDDDFYEIQPEAFRDNGRRSRLQGLKSEGQSSQNDLALGTNSMSEQDDILARYDKIQNIQNPWAAFAGNGDSMNGYSGTSLDYSNINPTNASSWSLNPAQNLPQGTAGFGQSFKDTANAWYNGLAGSSSAQSTVTNPFIGSSDFLVPPVFSPYQAFDYGTVEPSDSSSLGNSLPPIPHLGLPQPKTLQSLMQDMPNGLEEGLYENYRSRYDYIANDPTKTREELTSLLENIRPDEELPPENREGTPEAMTYPLMEHQKLGLTWLKNMEEGSNKGGILADDMGLGKTIQALSLIVSRPSTDPRRKSTLIIAPVALMKQWEREIQTKIKGGRHALTVYTLHGSKKGTWTLLRNYDVVLTTYGTLASEFNRREAWDKKKRGDPNAIPGSADRFSLLADECKWYRVIIDEAQFIKNKSTKAARGACCLQSITRFCMSGTPMMNNIGELFSLIEFLRIKPYNQIEKFNMDFTRPLKGSSQAAKDQAMRKLQALLKAILLRRTKKSKIDGAPILNLPERTTEIRHAVFDEDERAFYTALETKTQLQFNKYLKAGTVGKHYSNVLVLLLRLRQACCHPHLIRDFGVSANSEVSIDDMLALAKELAPEVVDRIKLQEAFECPICYDAVENPAIFIPCGHDTCSECFSKISDPAEALARGDGATDVKCPSCRSKLDPKKIIDYNAFKKVWMPESADIEGPILEDDDTASETESEDDELDENLNGFVVPDGVEDDETESGSGDGYVKGDNPFAKSRAQSKGEKPKKKDTKGKGKAKGSGAPSKSLAQLKKEGMRNVKARKRYMRHLKRDWISSAKLKKCVEILEQIQNRKEGEKTIIFSQFTSLLDLLEVPIDEQGWGFKRYDGSMSAVQRNQSVIEFTDRPDIRIMLVSLKAGNAGLNLVAASQVIILDPFWNPYVEEQAIDRSHRIGQLRPVQVHRILIQATVEDRIIELQNKKRALIEGALDEKASQNISRLGTRELAFLFGVGNQP